MGTSAPPALSTVHPAGSRFVTHHQEHSRGKSARHGRPQATSRSTFAAAAVVRSINSSVCAVEMKPISKAEGAR